MMNELSLLLNLFIALAAVLLVFNALIWRRRLLNYRASRPLREHVVRLCDGIITDSEASDEAVHIAENIRMLGWSEKLVRETSRSKATLTRKDQRTIQAVRARISHRNLRVLDEAVLSVALIAMMEHSRFGPVLAAQLTSGPNADLKTVGAAAKTTLKEMLPMKDRISVELVKMSAYHEPIAA